MNISLWCDPQCQPHIRLDVFLFFTFSELLLSDVSLWFQVEKCVEKCDVWLIHSEVNQPSVELNKECFFF